jgi:small subunit ribosomal protein S16
MDSRAPRDGKTIEELGTYDPMIRETDKRCTMKADRIDYWIGVGALPTEKVKALIDKYKGKVPDVRLDKAAERVIPPPPPPREKKVKTRSPQAEETAQAEAAAPAPEAAPAEPTPAAE